MDPNAALEAIRAIVAAHDADDDESVSVGMNRLDGMAELFVALDEWLSNGGFPPEAWREGPDAVGAETGPDSNG